MGYNWQQVGKSLPFLKCVLVLNRLQYWFRWAYNLKQLAEPYFIEMWFFHEIVEMPNLEWLYPIQYLTILSRYMKWKVVSDIVFY